MLGQKCQPAVAILFPDCFDDWLIDLGVALESFCDQMMGSWAFSYAQALNSTGVLAILFCISIQVRVPTRCIHKPTGAIIYFLPPSKIYRFFRRRRPIDATVSQPLRIADGLRITPWRFLRRLVATHVDTPLSLLFKELRNEGCKVLLVQEYETARFDLCVLFGKIKQVKVFGTFQGGQPLSALLRPLRRLAMWLCAGLLIPAAREANRVMSTYGVPPQKLDHVYSPVDFSIFYPSPKEESRRSLGIPANTRVVMYHGAINLSYKGLDVLLEAWNQLRNCRSNEDLRLFIIGTGDDAARFFRLISDKQLGGIEWMNQWVHDRHLIRRYLSSADVYVFPSRGDACPNAVIEAMACRLPIVASEVNGIPDLLKDGKQACGLLVPSEDPRAVAKALDDVLSDPTLARELGHQAFCRAKELFSMEAVGKQLRSILLN
ncbi:MAG: glycosyltransferase family 1 protein [Chloroflexi bacterium]|nr:MAG: glycosyltransferase family 1 protein [Chloroflexota bacterium]